jgi:uncharacterized membrane protein YhaH (DUF805 family)
MRGEVLRYDDLQGVGLISGADGNRYKFRRSDLEQLAPIAPGMAVDFVANGEEANEVFLLTKRDKDLRIEVASQTVRDVVAAPINLSPIDFFFRSLSVNLFQFSGRASRREFWWATIFAFIFQLSFVVVFLALISLESASLRYWQESFYMPLFAMLIWPILIWFGIAQASLSFRRMHDIGISGLWWAVPHFFALLLLAPRQPILALAALILGILNFWWMVRPSQKWENKFGHPPNAE